mmetsp:Transcript_88541/g.223638  ORF Transcript_88541/g.223638 Transcript_88541/m.223638 type:complete len:421 (+) Transcript_88541:634-1896(+)
MVSAAILATNACVLANDPICSAAGNCRCSSTSSNAARFSARRRPSKTSLHSTAASSSCLFFMSSSFSFFSPCLSTCSSLSLFSGSIACPRAPSADLRSAATSANIFFFSLSNGEASSARNWPSLSNSSNLLLSSSALLLASSTWHQTLCASSSSKRLQSCSSHRQRTLASSLSTLTSSGPKVLVFSSTASGVANASTTSGTSTARDEAVMGLLRRWAASPSRRMSSAHAFRSFCPWVKSISFSCVWRHTPSGVLTAATSVARAESKALASRCTASPSHLRMSGSGLFTTSHTRSTKLRTDVGIKTSCWERAATVSNITVRHFPPRASRMSRVKGETSYIGSMPCCGSERVCTSCTRSTKLVAGEANVCPRSLPLLRVGEAQVARADGTVRCGDNMEPSQSATADVTEGGEPAMSTNVMRP